LGKIGYLFEFLALVTGILALMAYAAAVSYGQKNYAKKGALLLICQLIFISISTVILFGWTPCIGPILASVLTFAANEQTLTSGIVLLSVYSLGLWVPFLLSAIFLSTCINLIKRFGKVTVTIEKIAGILLILLGILIMTNSLSLITIYLTT